MIKDAIRMTKGYRRRIAVSTAAGIMRVVGSLVFVALSKRAVDIATGQAIGSLVGCVAALAGVVLLELLCSAVANRYTELSETAMKNALQSRLFGRLLHCRWTGRETLHSGDMLSRLTEDCRVAAENLCRTVPAMLVAAVQLVAAFVFLWYFSPVLAITLFMLLPLFMLAGKLFFRRVRRYTRRIRNLESRLQENMQESLQHRILLLAFGQTARVMRHVADMHQSLYTHVRLRTDITNYSRTAVMAGFNAGYLVAFIWGVVGLRSGTVSFGLMTAYLQLAGQIQRPIAELARLLPGFVRSHTSFERLNLLENLPTEPDETESVSSMGETESVGLRFKDVTFAYPGAATPVLDCFSHTFAPGSRTAIIGETGTGKSTLLRLILAFLQPQKGSVELFGTDGTEVPVSVATRRNIVYVPQGNSLLSGTIRQNLRMGRHNATDEEMCAALHTAAADFVFSLPKGLDTPCGEHGDGLSEGQAQRIAIARGLLRNGSLLLLDEISASLDEATETLLMQRLMECSRFRTLILITHRPTSAAYCHHILKM